ncbi:MAG: hypothetical protein J6R85_06755 [Lentisphaeria bacterium]|nr:hypothetical protein [Lentisphaeria bacterium]
MFPGNSGNFNNIPPKINFFKSGVSFSAIFYLFSGSSAAQTKKSGLIRLGNADESRQGGACSKRRFAAAFFFYTINYSKKNSKKQLFLKKIPVLMIQNETIQRRINLICMIDKILSDP